MRILTWAAFGMAAAGAALGQSGLVVDGELGDEFWRGARAQALGPGGGEVRAGVWGSYGCVGARLPEPGGRILARSFGRNPVWEKDELGSPEVEDRVEFTFPGAGPELKMSFNPWGAYQLAGREGLRSAARIGAEDWSVEACFPLGWLGLGGRPGRIPVEAVRIRARRPVSPEQRWRWRGEIEAPAVRGESAPPEHRPPALGNQEAPLEVGRVPRLPDMSTDWEDPAWRDVPAFRLPRNEPYPRPAGYPTWVRWVHDGEKLALLVKLEEPEPVVARAGGRDSAVTGDDHLALHLATNGSARLEIAVNSVGAILDGRAMGPRGMRPQASWDAGIETRTDIRHLAWYARINLPLGELASALGEAGIPREWRVLVARNRARRRGEAAEVSALPPVGTSTFSAPLRYRRLALRDEGPAAVRQPETAWIEPPAAGLAHELATRDLRVWPPLERRRLGVAGMLGAQQARRAEDAVWAERTAWERVNTRQEWERFRDERMAAFRRSLGAWPPPRPPLDTRVPARHSGRGYRLENLAFQSRPGYYVAANLYLPESGAARMPGIIIVHSQHYPKTQGELHDMGEMWARAGCAVLIMERPGYGERAETSTWFRQGYGSRFNFSKQLFLVGESYSAWAAWDIIRCVDLLEARPDVDRDRIILLGAVAGGGEPAALAAALDQRIDAVAPFNYDQGHVRVHGDSPGQIAGQFSPWLIAASVAPRRFVRAFEFGWEGAEEHDYPSLWVDGMLRSRKVWDFYGAGANLASSQGYGLIRLSMERASHCLSIGPQQRTDLHPVFQRWFGIPLPRAEDLGVAPDSQLSTNPVREAARRQEAQRRRPHAELLSIPPELSSQLKRRKMHQLAHQMAVEYLKQARGRGNLRQEMAALLGDIAPGPGRARHRWDKVLPGARLEALVLEVESGIPVPLLFIRPETGGASPVVVGVAQGGKERFLASRAVEIERFIRAGIAVCLPDVRGTGETSPSADWRDGGPHEGLAQMEFDLGTNLVGARLKDLRTVLAYLRSRPDVRAGGMGLWGESFAPPNPQQIYLDEIEYPVSPQALYRPEPLGALLCLLGALYEEGVRAVAARGGLVSYLSLLEDSVAYAPSDGIVPGLLKVGDVPDIVSALAPRPVLLVGSVDGRNRLAAPVEKRDIVTTLIEEIGGRN